MKRQELSFRYPQSCQSCAVACYIHHAKRIYWQSPESDITLYRMNNNNTWHYFLSWICAFENVDMRESGIFHSLCHLLNINCMLSSDYTVSFWPVIWMLRACVACKMMCRVTLAFAQQKHALACEEAKKKQTSKKDS